MLKDIIWVSVAITLIEGMYSMTWIKDNWLFAYDMIILKMIDVRERLVDATNE